MPTPMDEVSQADAALFRAVNEAIDQAVRTTGEKLQALGVPASPHDYFRDAVLRHLFMQLCGADVETYRNGDPDIAWKILYGGRGVARRWEREIGRSSSIRKRSDRVEDIAKDQSERQQLEKSAECFALRTVLSALIEHARATDPQIDTRLQATVAAHAAELGGNSEAERTFIETAQSYLSIFSKPHD